MHLRLLFSYTRILREIASNGDSVLEVVGVSYDAGMTGHGSTVGGSLQPLFSYLRKLGGKAANEDSVILKVLSVS